jgi:hypothetical protein
LQTMKLNLLPFILLAFATAASAQSGPAVSITSATTQDGQAVSYASVAQLDGLLTQLETTSKATQADLVKLRVERWKTDGASKKQALGNVDSIQRNLQTAMPGMISTLRSTPEDLPATFKLYRNLDALYDVMGNVVEGAGAFGSKDDMQSLSNDLNAFEGTRRQLAERIESLSAQKETEIVRLRADLKTARAAVPAEPPKKTIIDDNEPAKKSAPKKKPAAKPSITLDKSKPAAAPNTQQQTPAAPQ